ncbi:MAG: response regulator [Desulfobulbaceae bacterium]|nr:response regulator [Desulfobulbaceae bacterium]
MNEQLDVSVLYVEDDTVTRERFAAIMARQVREVRAVGDGVEGLAMYQTMHPDIVVSDIRMPKMNGLDMAREIKRLQPEARILLTTAFNDKEFLMGAIDTGICGYVMKPVDADSLAAAIAQSAEVVVLRREVKRRDEEQVKLIAELQQALAEIKTLKGMIPICASCKNIRNDQGYWEVVEKYVMERTEAQFSHGICPKCIAKLYPDFVNELVDKL